MRGGIGRQASTGQNLADLNSMRNNGLRHRRRAKAASDGYMKYLLLSVLHAFTVHCRGARNSTPIAFIGPLQFGHGRRVSVLLNVFRTLERLSAGEARVVRHAVQVREREQRHAHLRLRAEAPSSYEAEHPSCARARTQRCSRLHEAHRVRCVVNPLGA